MIPTDLSIALAQMNPCVGDIEANLKQMLALCSRACEQGAQLIVFPELALCGYPPEDLLLRPDFQVMVDKALALLEHQSAVIDIIVGHPWRCPETSQLFNAASWLSQQKCTHRFTKRFLPNYGVFDERRYFAQGYQSLVYSWHGQQVAVLLCEDIWHDEMLELAKADGAQWVIALNASPFHVKKIDKRQQRLADCSARYQLPVIYCQCVGGQDELIFDGGTQINNADGQVISRAAFFKEDLSIINMDTSNQKTVFQPAKVAEIPSTAAQTYQALVLGLQDYCKKNHFNSIVLGLSGGIDSALTLAIASDALGAHNVHALAMPSKHSSAISLEDAKKQCERLGVILKVVAIDDLYQSIASTMAITTAENLNDLCDQNIQARVRGLLLMAYSNQTGRLVLTTGNKSELAVGYCTLYGDMVGGFSVLKDVSKAWVYRLAQYRNGLSPAIEERTISREPSAELAPGQKDSDNLPPYDILDAILTAYVEQDKGAEDIIAMGFDAKVVHQVIRRVDANEYKRRQAPIGVRITPRAFGRDRRYPITSGYAKQNIAALD